MREYKLSPEELKEKQQADADIELIKSLLMIGCIEYSTCTSIVKKTCTIAGVIGMILGALLGHWLW